MWDYVGRKKANPDDEEGEIWQSTLIDMDSRLRAARDIRANETRASIEVFQILKENGHPDVLIGKSTAYVEHSHLTPDPSIQILAPAS